MAQAWFESRLAEAAIHHVKTDSAGLLGIVGSEAAPEAVAVLQEFGVDLSTHRSRALDAERLARADLTLVMSLKQLAQFRRRWPGHLGPVHLLRAFEAGAEPAEGPPDLDDPVGRPIEVFRTTFDVIRPCVEHLLILLRHLP